MQGLDGRTKSWRMSRIRKIGTFVEGSFVSSTAQPTTRAHLQTPQLGGWSSRVSDCSWQACQVLPNSAGGRRLFLDQRRRIWPSPIPAPYSAQATFLIGQLSITPRQLVSEILRAVRYLYQVLLLHLGPPASQYSYLDVVVAMSLRPHKGGGVG